MDPRIDYLRECGVYLGAAHGGDHEGACLETGARTALSLAEEVLGALGSPPARGYKDACDKLVACGAVVAELGSQLKLVCDIADRLPGAWSTIRPGELDAARRAGAVALPAFAAVCERVLGAAPRPSAP